MSDEFPDEIEDGEEQHSETDAADPVAIKRKETRKKLYQREAVAFWHSVLSDPVGRREIWRLLQDAHTFETKFACGPNGFPQSEATFFQLGEQMFGQRLYQTLALYDRENVLLMHDEHDNRFPKEWLKNQPR